MVPWLNDSLILQNDLTRRILFCASLGLILASLGKVNKIFAVGGATAIALALFYMLSLQTVELISQARIRFDNTVKVKSVVLIPADPGEYRATIDPQYIEAKIYRFRFPLSIGEKITDECFSIKVSTETGESYPFSIQGGEARLPQTAAWIFDFLFDEKTKSLKRTTKRGSTQDIPACTEADHNPRPTQKDLQSPNQARTGWTLYGWRGNGSGSWEQRVYENKTRGPTAEPRQGDKAKVIDDVYLRTQPRKCRTDNDCDALSPDTGILRIGTEVDILEVIPVREKNIWVRVETK
jgi:hypothetical protein